MKNIKQLFTGLISENSDVQDLTNTINSLTKSIQGEKPVFGMIKLRNLSQVYADSFNLFVDFIDSVDDYIEETRPSNIMPDDYSTGWRKYDVPSDNNVLLILQKLLSVDSTNQIFTTFADQAVAHPGEAFYVNAGSISGYPLSIKFEPSIGSISGQGSYTACNIHVNIRGQDFDNVVNLYNFSLEKFNGQNPSIYLNNINYQKHHQLIDEVITLDDVLNRCESNSVDNTIITELIDATTMQGDIGKETVLQVIDKYGETPFCVFTRDAISRVGSFSYLSMFTIITSWFKSTQGDHESDKEYYSPMEYQNFCADLIAVVNTTLVSIIGTVLNIVFAIIGGALGIILAVISQVLLNLSTLAESQVNAKAIKISLDPTYNYPIRALIFDQFRLNGFTTELNDFGVVAMTPINDPAFSLVVGRSPDSIYRWGQILINGDGYYLSETPTISISTSGDNTRVDLLSARFNTDYKYTRVSKPSLSYVTLDDIALRKQIIYATLALCLDHCHVSNIHHDYSFSIPTVTYIAIVTDIVNYDHDNRTIGDIISHICDAYSLTSSQAWTIFALWYVGGIDASVTSFQTYVDNSTISWDRVTKYLPDFLNNYWLLKFVSVNSSNFIIVDSSELYIGSGVAKLDPSIEYPNISRSALINGVIVGALSAAAIAGTTILAGRVIKNRAAIKLAKREAAFEESKKNLAANPKDPAAKKQLAKDNRKLTRAWNHAGKAGLTTYNGFDTGASASSSESGSAVNNFKAYLRSDSSKDIDLLTIHQDIVG